MAWCRAGDKPLSEPIMFRSLTHICVTRPQWVTKHVFIIHYHCIQLYVLFFTADCTCPAISDYKTYIRPSLLFRVSMLLPYLRVLSQLMWSIFWHGFTAKIACFPSRILGQGRMRYGPLKYHYWIFGRITAHQFWMIHHHASDLHDSWAKLFGKCAFHQGVVYHVVLQKYDWNFVHVVWYVSAWIKVTTTNISVKLKECNWRQWHHDSIILARYRKCGLKFYKSHFMVNKYQH